MITVEEAKQLLFASVRKSRIVKTDLIEAAGCVLAEDIFSPLDLPSFNQSAMDGYAVSSDEKNKNQFKVVGEIKAGDSISIHLKKGEAVRIYTGAMVPETADAIVIREKAEQVNGSIHIQDDFKTGNCIRVKGSQIKKSELALKQGTILNPAAIGFLASIGIDKIKIYKKPDVSIVVTGNEIMKPGSVLNEGQIFESNSFSLHAALKQMQINPDNIFTANDEKAELKNKIQKCIEASDIVIITGGISVGKYDLVNETLNELNVETIFYKVAQKPGKPFLFGKLDEKIIFALPGNPAAVLVCFYEYAYPSVRTIQGFENCSLPSLRLKITNDIFKKEDRALFLRGKKTGNEVLPLEKQDSNMLGSFAEADCLIYIEGEKEIVHRGEEVEVHLLPFN
jgi:molybdopterin molybdotransferase